MVICQYNNLYKYRAYDYNNINLFCMYNKYTLFKINENLVDLFEYKYKYTTLPIRIQSKDNLPIKILGHFMKVDYYNIVICIRTTAAARLAIIIDVIILLLWIIISLLYCYFAIATNLGTTLVI